MRSVLIPLVVICTLALSTTAMPCPLCDPVGRTISEDMRDACGVLVVTPTVKRNVTGAETVSSTRDAGSRAKFVEIVRRFKVNKDLAFDDQLKLSRDGLREGQLYLLVGFGSPNVQWATPKETSEEGIAYLEKLLRAPDLGADRLAFFLTYLDSNEKLIADDAYNEFAIAPYPDVKALGKDIDSKDLLGRLQRPNLSSRLRRLYYMLLSVSGCPLDAPYVRERLELREPNTMQSLDAAVACYLSLTGKNGLDFVNRHFLNEPRPSEVFAVVKALRFHGEEETVISRAELASSLRMLLKHATCADQVIADLARWQDWDAMPQLIGLLDESSNDKAALRAAIIQYLLVCPKPEAKKRLAELRRESGPEVDRAQIRLFPFPPVPEE